jgi:hypothetical protein
MTIKEFEALDINAKANAVWEGKFISSHVVDDVFVQLYKLKEFYVEVYYDPMKNEIVSLKAI